MREPDSKGFYALCKRKVDDALTQTEIDAARDNEHDEQSDEVQS